MTVKSYAVVENDVITNTILLDDEAEWPVPDNAILVEITEFCGIGWQWNGVQFIAPVEPEPAVEVIAEGVNVLAE